MLIQRIIKSAFVGIQKTGGNNVLGYKTGAEVENINLAIALGSFVVIGGIALIIYVALKPLRDQKKFKARLKEQGINNLVYLNHEYGLSLPKDIRCKLTSFSDRIEIESNNMKFNLYKKDIVNAYLKTDVEITSQYVSSAGNAVAGAMMYGPAGAAIGGRIKEKKYKETHYYVILTYNKDNKMNFIGFDATNSYPQATKLVLEIKSGLKGAKVVDL